MANTSVGIPNRPAAAGVMGLVSLCGSVRLSASSMMAVIVSKTGPGMDDMVYNSERMTVFSAISGFLCGPLPSWGELGDSDGISLASSSNPQLSAPHASPSSSVLFSSSFQFASQSSASGLSSCLTTSFSTLSASRGEPMPIVSS